MTLLRLAASKILEGFNGGSTSAVDDVWGEGAACCGRAPRCRLHVAGEGCVSVGMAHPQSGGPLSDSGVADLGCRAENGLGMSVETYSASSPSVLASPGGRRRMYRRCLVVVACCQLFGGAGLAAGATVGG